MRTYIIFTTALTFSFFGPAQKTIEKTLERFNSESVPYMTVEELKMDSVSFVLDTRKKEEFEVSHLENAYWVGFDEFDLDKVKKQIPDPSTSIVVYCSIGVRSETIGEKLQAAGYLNIKNLYGGIFQWKKEGEPVVDSLGQPTERVHAFSKHWGKLLTNAEKVYSPKQKVVE